MKQPDRFKEMVLSHSYDEDYIPTCEAVKLLRAEHRAVVRLVKRELAKENKYAQAGSYWLAGYEQACHNIFVALARRMK